MRRTKGNLGACLGEMQELERRGRQLTGSMQEDRGRGRGRRRDERSEGEEERGKWKRESVSK